MDNKTSSKADEKSATRLSPLASKSQSRGESIKEMQEEETMQSRSGQ
ncbi:MAG: hypothetical protein OWR52_03220 [Acidibacillus sp.]|uniref:Uncharacterized protein n=1 Tax=Sulfoacidibacillus ferrooxidans TaxID=2005001 RepID=A0A9X1V7M0_9BACL|nr:hypothetical protein [Sulfoacidibacillus ferrooxidans]MCI0182715.1 hypothetical protein [Sulfoacidibacillus ferrooxidans]MCY0892504.1 hypothetical protein [Acidibacillus sp.]